MRPCRIWEVTSVVNKRVRHEGQTIQEFVKKAKFQGVPPSIYK